MWSQREVVVSEEEVLLLGRSGWAKVLGLLCIGLEGLKQKVAEASGLM